jgi:hypothetical protein
MARHGTFITTALALMLCASAARADIIEAGVAQSQRCIYKVLTSTWPVDHDPARATNQAVSVCEPDLMALLLHFQPATDRAMIHMHMIEEARRQLHIIVGDGL